MKQFTITYVCQAYFGQGFRTHTEKVWGALDAYVMLKRIRSGKNPALMIWITCK